MSSRNANSSGPFLSPAELPSGDNIILHDSSFFHRANVSLPSPDDVRQASGIKETQRRPRPVVFASRNLIVKYGTAINIAEGQCLWAIRKFLPSVPVPEVYGWATDGGETFLYMELIEGTTLQEAWPDMDVQEKYEVCQDLSHILDDLRTLKQDPAHPFVGDISGGPLHDVFFDDRGVVGPFDSVKEFYDFFSTMSSRRLRRECDDVPFHFDPWRSGLANDVPVVFTHNDLHRSNIMVSWTEEGKPRAAALVDWHQSGWLPAPWESYKTRVTGNASGGWEVEFVLEFLHSHRGFVSWQYYVRTFL